MAEEGQAVSVEASGCAVVFQRQPQMGEMVPGGVAAHEGTGDDFAGVIIEGEDEHRVVVSQPPGMGRTVVLPEFANGAGLPAAAWFGAASGRADALWEMVADVGGDGGARAVKVQTAGEFVGEQREIERLAVRKKIRQEIVCGFGPGFFVVASGGGQLEAGAVLEPAMAQLVEAGGADHEPLSGGEGIERALVESG